MPVRTALARCRPRADATSTLADRVADPGRHGLSQPLDRFGPGRPGSPTEPDRARELVDDRVVLDPGPLGAAEVVGRVGVVDLLGQLGQPLPVGGDRPARRAPRRRCRCAREVGTPSSSVTWTSRPGRASSTARSARPLLCFTIVVRPP